MQHLPKREKRPGLLPHVGDSVFNYLRFSPHAPSEDATWSNLGSEQGPMVKHALQLADELRSGHADPGDAYLAGIALAYAAFGEQLKREAFLRQMMQPTADKHSA